MKAVKENKAYMIDEKQKSQYLAQGYDIVTDDGKVEHSPKATVAYAEYQKVKTELEELKVEREAEDEKEGNKKAKGTEK